MSFAELKEQVAALSLTERFQLAAFLTALDEAGEAEFQAEAGRRMQAMDAGQKVTAQDFEAMHEKLRSQGR